MDLRKYEVFLRVAECGNITKTAEELGYTQSGVSHMMKSLEEEFGFPLFTRTRTGITVTQEGYCILPVLGELAKWNEQLRQVVAQIKGFEVGKIRIGVFESISFSWLPKILAQFHHDYPNIDVDLLVGGANEIEGWLSEKSVDMGMVRLYPHSKLDTVPLYKDDYVAVLPPDFPVGNKKVFPLEDFNKQTFIMTARESDFDIHAIIEKYHIVPSIKFSSTDDHTILSMVASGLGVTILPNLILTGRSCRIRHLPLKPALSRTLGIAVPSLKEASPAVRRFIGCAVAVMKEDPKA